MAIKNAKGAVEAIQFKHWLYEITDQVTLACKSGGFLRIDGTQVAEGEGAFLSTLREAIDMPAMTD